MDYGNKERWTPVEDIDYPLYVNALHGDYEGLRILLKSERSTSRMLQLWFDAPMAYRNADEVHRLKVLEELGDRELRGWPLYVVDDSEFLRWFRDQSLGIYDNQKVTHYLIVTPNDIVEVLSLSEPVVEWL